MTTEPYEACRSAGCRVLSSSVQKRIADWSEFMDCESDGDMGQDMSYVTESKDDTDVVGHSSTHARRKPKLNGKGEKCST